MTQAGSCHYVSSDIFRSTVLHDELAAHRESLFQLVDPHQPSPLGTGCKPPPVLADRREREFIAP